MEEQIEFTAAEIALFSRNPVAKASFKDLVFLCGDAMGFIECAQGEGEEPDDSPSQNTLKSRDTVAFLISWNGRRTPLGQNRLLRIAHPLDLSRGHIWREYQRSLFDRKIRQPFKQVFRELYVKPSGEMDQTCSRMFAGSRMQHQRTAGLLEGKGLGGGR